MVFTGVGSCHFERYLHNDCVTDSFLMGEQWCGILIQKSNYFWPVMLIIFGQFQTLLQSEYWSNGYFTGKDREQHESPVILE